MANFLTKFNEKRRLKRSIAEVREFVDMLGTATADEAGLMWSNTAILHYAIGLFNDEFFMVLKSKKGENIDLIGEWMLTLQTMADDYRIKGQEEYSAAAIFWYINLKCMSVPALQSLGVKLWSNVVTQFESSHRYLLKQLEIATDTGNDNMVKKINGALELYTFIPPQFSK